MIENSDWAARIEDKLDKILEAVHAQDVRLTKVESQVSFAKWLGTVTMSCVAGLATWLLNISDKFHN